MLVQSHGQFTSGEKASGTHLIGIWVGPKWRSKKSEEYIASIFRVEEEANQETNRRCHQAQLSLSPAAVGFLLDSLFEP
jgi:hypothetical protein